MREDFLRVLMTSMHIDPGLLSQPGVTVAGTPHRAQNHVTAGYEIGDHFVITCDPAVEQLLTEEAASMSPTMAAWTECATRLNGELLGTGRMQLVGAGPGPQSVAEGFLLRSLERDDPDDLALITRLIERSDEDDLDMAEIELDNLDAIIEVAVDSDGEIASFSSARPFDMASGYGDIGIMTRPDCRGKGLGSAAVAALCPRLRHVGLEPLYRCDEDNIGSIQLSAGLGFEIVTQLSAYRFAT